MLCCNSYVRCALCCALLVAAALAAARAASSSRDKYLMDFVAQAAGTPADQALQARGPDHDVDTATNDSFITVLGDALQHRNAVGGRSRICYSSVSGALSGHFFTRDQTVLASALHGAVPAPAKMQALWQYQLANGPTRLLSQSCAPLYPHPPSHCGVQQIRCGSQPWHHTRPKRIQGTSSPPQSERCNFISIGYALSRGGLELASCVLVLCAPYRVCVL